MPMPKTFGILSLIWHVSAIIRQYLGFGIQISLEGLLRLASPAWQWRRAAEIAQPVHCRNQNAKVKMQNDRAKVKVFAL
jgi:hypothetical protein